METRTQLEHEANLTQVINSKYKQAYVAKADKMRDWRRYKSAYDGKFFKEANRPEYKSNQVSNYIFSTVEAIRPIMVDNDPRFIATPILDEGSKYASDVQLALDYEWNRSNMSIKLTSQLIPMLIYGTAIWYIGWDGNKGKIGEVDCKAVNPFNFFPDPLAEDIESASYVIYASYKSANQLKKDYPSKAKRFIGSSISQSELVEGRDDNVIGDQNQILVLECWYRDWSTIDQEQETLKGNSDPEPVFKYPTGRVTAVCPDLNIVLFDKKNPYKDGRFPFIMMKDHDIPFEFWGRGEVEQILSPQIYMNELTNQIVDNAKMTANTAWILDHNCGINHNQLVNAPGAIIRKRAGTEVRRDAPLPIPNYVSDQIGIFKKDIQDISGVFDSLKGDKQTGVVSAQAIMALQEASQARIRLKIKLLERFLGDLANVWYKRIQQFWLTDKWVMVTDIDGNIAKKLIDKNIREYDYEINIGAGSTMPTNKNAMLDLMIRLAQTSAEDGLPMVDRKAVLQYLPAINRKEILEAFDKRVKDQEKKADEANDAQAKIQEAQQLAEADKKNLVDTVKQLRDMFQMVSGQVDELMTDKAKREDEEKFQTAEDRGYQKGVRDGERNGVQNEEEAGEENFAQEAELIDEADLIPGEDMMPGQLDDETLEYLSSLSPEELQEVLSAEPWLRDMIDEDTMETEDAIGMINEGMIPNMPGFDFEPEMPEGLNDENNLL